MTEFNGMLLKAILEKDRKIHHLEIVLNKKNRKIKRQHEALQRLEFARSRRESSHYPGEFFTETITKTTKTEK